MYKAEMFPACEVNVFHCYLNKSKQNTQRCTVLLLTLINTTWHGAVSVSLSLSLPRPISHDV